MLKILFKIYRRYQSERFRKNMKEPDRTEGIGENLEKTGRFEKNLQHLKRTWEMWKEYEGIWRNLTKSEKIWWNLWESQRIQRSLRKSDRFWNNLGNVKELERIWEILRWTEGIRELENNWRIRRKSERFGKNLREIWQKSKEIWRNPKGSVETWENLTEFKGMQQNLRELEIKWRNLK